MYLLNIVTSFKKEGLLFMPLSGFSMSVFLLLFCLLSIDYLLFTVCFPVVSLFSGRDAI